MPTKIQLRRGTSSQWTSANPVLSPGEVGYITDLKQAKIGDGSTSWNSLPYTFISESDAEALVSAHASRTDNPHSVTATQVGADPTGTAASALSSHIAENDPHTQYETKAALSTALSLKYDAANPAGYVNSTQAANAAPVQSVSGRTGAVTLSKSDVGLNAVPNVDATARTNHTGTQLSSTISDFNTAVSALVPVTSVSGRTGAVVLTKNDVGLSSVPDVNATQRASHTGTQLSSTISDFSTAADARITLQKGAANGISTLDASGKQPIGENPVGSAVSISTSTVNSQGTASSLALSDHTHAVSLASTETKATTTTTTTSTTDALVTGMTLTPAAGTYLVIFSVGGVTHGTNSATITFTLYSNGSAQTGTARQVIPRVSNNTFTMAAATQGVVTVNGSQAIEARWATSGGTATCGTRSLSVIKLA